MIDANWCKKAIINYVLLMPEGFPQRRPVEVERWLDTMLANLIGIVIREYKCEKEKK